MTSSTAIGWVRVLTHRGVTITGRWSTSWRVISQERPPAPMTMPARSTVTGTPADAQQLPRPRGGSQVLGQVVLVAAEATEVDDLAHAGVRRRLAEGRGRLGVLAGEVVGVQGVHEVVRPRAALQGGGQRGSASPTSPNTASRARRRCPGAGSWRAPRARTRPGRGPAGSRRSRTRRSAGRCRGTRELLMLQVNLVKNSPQPVQNPVEQEHHTRRPVASRAPPRRGWGPSRAGTCHG